MSQKYEKLKTLLKELFQLDQPDLDFGLYRVMHAKSAEVPQFLDEDLLPQVKDAFALYRSADKARTKKELGKAVEQAQGLGVDPETTRCKVAVWESGPELAARGVKNPATVMGQLKRTANRVVRILQFSVRRLPPSGLHSRCPRLWFG